MAALACFHHQAVHRHLCLATALCLHQACRPFPVSLRAVVLARWAVSVLVERVVDSNCSIPSLHLCCAMELPLLLQCSCHGWPHNWGKIMQQLCTICCMYSTTSSGYRTSLLSAVAPLLAVEAGTVSGGVEGAVQLSKFVGLASGLPRCTLSKVYGPSYACAGHAGARQAPVA